ncbi:type II toxin-antitoxin system VapC family toxin [Dehalogenimonas etheniformans]|uniref:PIN domain-containing protein n=1 Tax=Dehalogenimonas etheniformans TaxID=1536648 RepID=A0A2P5P7H1_9CHLR|nr:type II toxin-antitoxin system VapC family toxin [Dehalogenimonas etheniformans]PPD58247.1 PIN domain-containing protein [Dehalogenimonas etheniformans]QNT75656.1 type II toxin-antitoxin system VapC family toxin [Dehalogenimonas etheniformans]
MIITTPSELTKPRILVDTDVVSYLLKADTRAEFYKPFLLNKTVAISFVTIAELYYWAYLRAWGQAKVAQMEATIKNYVVLPYDYSLCQQWATIKHDGARNGHPMDNHDNDCWIASTALLHDCALATNNRRHYEYINGLDIICPSLFETI